MSRASEYSYELERAKQQALYRARAGQQAERAYWDYMRQYEQMRRDGYAAYIPEEMRRLESDLDRIRQLLTKDPEEAREVSFEVGSYILQLGHLARAAREQFDCAERMRQEALREQARERKNALQTEYYRQVGEISPAVVHFAQADLQKLQTALTAGKLDSMQMLQKEMAAARKSAEIQAAQWRKEAGDTAKKQAVLSRLDEAEASIGSEKIEDREKALALVEHVRSLRESLRTGAMDPTSTEQALSQVEDRVDELVVTEQVRRQAVAAFVKLLQDQEFTVSPPVLVRSGGGNYVKITAQRPSGNRVECRFDLSGKMKYKFEHYKGMACLKDIEKVKVDLDRIYSVKLSDERVLWENPDRLSRDADRMPTGDGERRQG